jgi:hypothetical protein
MSIPVTRGTFKAFVLRTLGDGVLQINVSDAQVEDRIDQALYKYQQFHMDAVVKTYVAHEITGTLMTFTGPVTSFANNEQLLGETSNASGTCVLSNPQGHANAIVMFTTSKAAPTDSQPPIPGVDLTLGGHFVDGEVVRGLHSGFSATIATSDNTFTAILKGDMDNKYVTLDPSIIAITRIFAPFDSRFSADILFDPQSQFNMSLMSNFTSTSIIPYFIGRSYQQLLNDTFRGRPGTRFERHQGRVYVDVNWFSTFFPGQFLIVEGMQTIDPDAFPLIWSDRWLQDYTTSLIKKQWGMNLKKYNGIALPGGVTLDGKTMFDEAIVEIKALEDDLDTKFQLPIDFMVG